MKRKFCLAEFAIIALMIFSYYNVLALAEEKHQYVFNPSYHGALLYNREKCIIGILLNGLEIAPEMLNTGIEYIDDKVCIKLPGTAAYAWIEEKCIVDELPLTNDLITGITNYAMDSGYLYTSPTLLSVETGDRLKDEERVVIGGRYLDSYYLPDKEPHWINSKELSMKVNNQEAKFRIYQPDLLSYRELIGMSGEPDGTEQFNETTALERAKEILEQKYRISGLDQKASKCGLNISHIYTSIGKTWFFSFGHYGEEQYYTGELVDATGELFMLERGGEDEYLVYRGFPCDDFLEHIGMDF